MHSFRKSKQDVSLFNLDTQLSITTPHDLRRGPLFINTSEAPPTQPSAVMDAAGKVGLRVIKTLIKKVRILV